MFCVVNLSEKLINLKHGQVVGFAYEVSDIIEGDTEEVKVQKVSTSSTVSSNEFPEYLCDLLARSEEYLSQTEEPYCKMCYNHMRMFSLRMSLTWGVLPP